MPKTQWKLNAAQFWLVCLLVLLANWLYFYYVGSVLAVSLIVGLVIDEVLLMAEKVAVSLSIWFI